MGATSSSSSLPATSSIIVPTRSSRRRELAKKRKRRGFADDQAKFLRRHVGLRAFLHAERRDAQRLDRRFHAGHGGHGSLDADVIGARGAAANPQAVAVPHPAVVGRAARDGEIEFRAFQFLGGLAAVRREPAVEHFDHALFERGGLERAAVEQHGGRMHKRLAGHLHRRVVRGRHRAGLPREERGEMARDAGVLGVGQGHLRQAGAARDLAAAR